MIRPLMWGLIKMRNSFSILVNSRRSSTSWRPAIGTIGHLKTWMQENFRYKHDFLGGYADNTKSIGAMCHEYRDKGKIKGDCDDAATFIAWTLKNIKDNMWEPIEEIWRVNIPKHRHVLCVWTIKRDGEMRYYYSSNRTFYIEVVFTNIAQIVYHYGHRNNKKLNARYYAEPVRKIRF